jgi:hypothetical protein
MTETSTAPTVVRQSRAKIAGLLCGCAGFAALGWWAYADTGSVVLLLAIAAFVLFAPLAIWLLIEPGTLRLSDEGVGMDIAWSHTFWPWSDITAVERARTPLIVNGLFLHIRSRSVPVRLVGWSIGLDELAALLKRGRAAASAPATTVELAP